jgi:FkbM family methyltransferase
MAESRKARLRRGVNRLLHPLGLHLLRCDRVFEMEDVLARAAKRGVPVRTVIDVGASDGSWSLLAKQHFPAARFLLFEPLVERREALEALRQRLGFDYVTAAAGARRGEVALAVAPDLDGSSVAPAGAAGGRTVPIETIDAAVAEHRLPGPFCLKLDTHGYELPILEGAAAVLAQASLLIIEAYNFRLGPEALKFHELCAWLEPRGFRCCDLADPMRRPKDGVLWQVDLVFVPATSPVFASDRYE